MPFCLRLGIDMRPWALIFLFSAVVALAAAPARGDSDLTFTLVSNTGSGSPTSISPGPEPPCLAPNCVLFTGTLTDTDVDTDPTYPDIILSTISVAFSTNPAVGILSIDNTFYDSTDYVPSVLSGDPNYATDGLGNPPNSYSGAIFGIDIATGTSLGVYNGTITIEAAGGLSDPGYSGFIVTQPITVDVIAPEPAAGSLSLAGLAALSVWCGLKRKWRTSEARSR
jgi:hypothetical protein